MPVYEATRETEVAAPRQALFDVLTDYERMPEWQSRVQRCEVVSHDAHGRGEIVDYEIDAKLRTVRYRLRHDYAEPSHIGSTYLEGAFRCFEGEYELLANGGGTHVRFSLRIDPGLRVPGRIARMLNETVMGRTLDDLKYHVERGAHG